MGLLAPLSTSGLCTETTCPDSIRASYTISALRDEALQETKTQQQQPSSAASSPIQGEDSFAIPNLNNQKREAKEQDQLHWPCLCAQEGLHPGPNAWSPTVFLGCYREPSPSSEETGISFLSPSWCHLLQSRQNSHQSTQRHPYSQHEMGFLQVFIHSNVAWVLVRSTPECFYKVVEYRRKPYDIHAHTKWVHYDLSLSEKRISKGLLMVLP